MGRKSQPKQNTKKPTGKELKLVHQKRKEIAILVDKMLKTTSIFLGLNTAAKNWEHYLEISSLVSQVCAIEHQPLKRALKSRQQNMDQYLKWLTEHGVQYDGVEIAEFEGYELGLKATKDFKESSLILTVPAKLMMTEKHAKESELKPFISGDPILQNMPNINLALFLIHEKNNPDSFWKPYIDVLPEKYSSVLYFTAEEMYELRPSPVFDSALKLYRSIARQYAYFHNKIHTSGLEVAKRLQDVFTFENYRWAVTTVMTRQNNVQLSDAEVAAFIPLWDMCNHETGKITTDFNHELNQGECYALRDFKPGDQIFIFYGARPNSDLFLHNGFVYPDNPHDYLSLQLGISSKDRLRDMKKSLLTKLGLAEVTHFNLFPLENPVSAELLAFIRIFNMNQDELTKWSSQGLPSDLVSSDSVSSAAVGNDIDRRAYTYLLTRCGLLKAAYKDIAYKGDVSQCRKNIQMLKESEIRVLDCAMKSILAILEQIPPPTESAQ